MVLNDEEQRMLGGEFGDGTAEAMKLQVAIGEAFDAERMVAITRAHVSLAHYPSDVWYCGKLAAGGARCRVKPTCNPLYDIDYLESIGIRDSANEAELLRTLRQTFLKLGIILTYSCTPEIQSNVPRFGEIVAFAESSATPYVNAVCGARSNRESAKSALAAAITGRAPLYGYLLDENRHGDVLIQVETPIEDDFDYHLLGYAASKKMGSGVPVFTGMPRHPSPEELVSFGAQLATGGSVGMYHIVGVTPEAPDLATACGGRTPERKLTLTNRDLRETKTLLSQGKGDFEFVMLGCPHYSIGQVAEVAELLDGKKIRPEISFWVLTSPTTRDLAARMGYLDIIQQAGGHIIGGTCADISCWYGLYSGKVGVTDSVKAAYYTPRMDMNFQLKRRSECIEIALKGGQA
ncbi:MAG: aconitase X catalytic domain-containing protein [Thermodesulfobacteriota bacterium]